MNIKEEIIKIFGHKLRVRVCGLCFKDDKLLLIKHKGIGKKGVLWAPPGGGVHFKESAELSLIREFKEETNLEVSIKEFLFVYEFIDPPLHDVELFFEVTNLSGKPTIGLDPEMPEGSQILVDLHFFSCNEIKSQPPETFHYIFQHIRNFDELRKLKGYYTYHGPHAKVK